ncbi:MAG: gluconate 2-dehydrogenase subunit 3 family protein [Gemmatimonadetes bacterium]|nr:gluconate 2-dehydrogenase subunit 3 family protein [Gemmatimonadota bacterium]
MDRREFVGRSAFYGTTFWLLLNVPRPKALRAAASSTEALVFSEEEWRTVEAITARIIPTDRDPGAIEANCVNFIDKALANEDADLLPTYRKGLPRVNAVAVDRFGGTFAEIAPDQQDEVLMGLESGDVSGWTAPATPEEFFEIVRSHTLIGFLADPKYGGNRDYVGWKLAGYPGPRHDVGGYTPAQMIGEERIKTIWGEEI